MDGRVDAGWPRNPSIKRRWFKASTIPDMGESDNKKMFSGDGECCSINGTVGSGLSTVFKLVARSKPCVFMVYLFGSSV